MQIYKIFISLFLLAAVSGCSSKETLINKRQVTIPVPAVTDTLPDAEIVNAPEDIKTELETVFSKVPDSTYIAAESVLIDTAGRWVKTKVKFYPAGLKNLTPGSKNNKPAFIVDVAQAPVSVSPVDTAYRRTNSFGDNVRSLSWLIIAAFLCISVILIIVRRK